MSSVARRYAKAILAVAEGENELEKCGEELAALAALTAGPEVSQAIANPMVAEGKRRELAVALAGEIGARPTMRNFMSVLADNQRLDQLGNIAVQYRKLLDQKLGRVRAIVKSASALGDADLQRIVETFEKKTGKQVLAEAIVDESLLGGVVVDIEGQVFDGSLRNQLKSLADDIAGSQTYI